jgi:hypothetical protein
MLKMVGPSPNQDGRSNFLKPGTFVLGMGTSLIWRLEDTAGDMNVEKETVLGLRFVRW